MSKRAAWGEQRPWRGLLDLLFPPRCGGCGARGAWLCADCLRSVRRSESACCWLCGLPAEGTRLCFRCRSRPRRIDAILAAAAFQGPLREAIHTFKYRNTRPLAEPLARLLQERWAGCALSADLVVPVPLHPERQWQRGYNQSTLLARRFARGVGVRCVEGILLRNRATLPQVELRPLERRENVQDAFLCRPHTSLPGRRIILVDDVATTGATLEAAAMPLYAAGAAQVWGLVVARGD